MYIHLSVGISGAISMYIYLSVGISGAICMYIYLSVGISGASCMYVASWGECRSAVSAVTAPWSKYYLFKLLNEIILLLSTVRHCKGLK